MENFEKELESLINKHSMENASDTPDFILARYLFRCLQTFNDIMHKRENWYGREINELKERITSPPKACKTPEEIAVDFCKTAAEMNANNTFVRPPFDNMPKITPEQLLEDSDLSFKTYKQVKDIFAKCHKKPTGIDWEITLICPTNLGPNCPIGHNGKNLSDNYKILRITTTIETSTFKKIEDYDLGDKIREGIIESFRLTNGYPQAVILGTGKLVDVDNFRKNWGYFKPEIKNT